MSEQHPEQPHKQQPEQPDETPRSVEEIVELVNSNPWNQDPNLWDADEEVGDIYSVEINEDGEIEQAERIKYPHPMVWIACLAAYNDGHLHGEWVDAAVDDEALAAAAQRVLASSPIPGAEEYAIFDSDEFGTYKVGEYARLEDVARVARGIAEHGPAFAAWAELHDGDPDDLDRYEDAFAGSYESASEWAHEILFDSWLTDAMDTVVPESMRPYILIDCRAWARDAELNGDIYVEANPEGGVWIFYNH